MFECIYTFSFYSLFIINGNSTNIKTPVCLAQKDSKFLLWGICSLIINDSRWRVSKEKKKKNQLISFSLENLAQVTIFNQIGTITH